MRSSAASVLVSTLAATTLLGCKDCPDGGWQPTRSVDLGVTADLHAVADAMDSYHAIAVGSGGTVVRWGYRGTDVFFLETFTVADVELRGVTDVGGGRWVVFGDGGFVAASDDRGETWTSLDLATTADFHAIVSLDESVVLVGDEVVRVVLADNTWLEPPTPEGGWGQLRALGPSRQYSSEEPTTFAAGLGGVIWSTTDPSGDWVAENSGVSEDLFAVGRVVAVGANGTFLRRDADGEWFPIETNRTADFIDYEDYDSYGALLAADGEVLSYDSDGLEHIDRIEGARALLQDEDGLIAVGGGGMVVAKRYLWCE